MTDELIKKLRERGGQWPVAAADRIVELDKENDILLQEVEYLEMMRDDLQKAFTRAADTRDRFRKLLTDIVDEYNDQVHGPILHSIVAARAELEAKPDHVNETLKSEHEGADMLTPATKAETP